MVTRSFTRLMKIKKHSHFPTCVVLEHESMVVTSELWVQTRVASSVCSYCSSGTGISATTEVGFHISR